MSLFCLSVTTLLPLLFKLTNCITIIQKATLDASNLFDNGATMTPLYVDINNSPREWKLIANTSSGFHLQLTLNASIWGFHPTAITTLQIEVNADGNTGISDSHNLLVAFQQTASNQYFATLISMDQVYGHEMIPDFTTSTPYSSYLSGDVKSRIDSNTYDYRSWYANYESWGYPFGDIHVEPPLVFILKNYPNAQGNYLWYTYKNPNVSPTSCGFNTALNADTEINIYFAADSYALYDSVDIASITIMLTYDIDTEIPTNDPTSDPTTEPSKYPSDEATISPSKYPSISPTYNPTKISSVSPSYEPSILPSTTVSSSKYPTMDDTESMVVEHGDQSLLNFKAATDTQIIVAICIVLICCIIPLSIGIAICCCIYKKKIEIIIRKRADTKIDGNDDNDDNNDGSKKLKLAKMFSVTPPGLAVDDSLKITPKNADGRYITTPSGIKCFSPIDKTLTVSTNITLHIEGFEKDIIESDGSIMSKPFKLSEIMDIQSDPPLNVDDNIEHKYSDDSDDIYIDHGNDEKQNTHIKIIKFDVNNNNNKLNLNGIDSELSDGMYENNEQHIDDKTYTLKTAQNVHSYPSPNSFKLKVSPNEQTSTANSIDAETEDFGDV